MRRILVVGVVIVSLVVACSRYAVPPEKDLPNPHIGGRVFGPAQP